MRKREKQELLERIEKLEKRNKELEYVADFLSRYDRDTVVISDYIGFIREFSGTQIRYLYGANLVSVKIPLHHSTFCKIVKKSDKEIVLNFCNCYGIACDKFYLIDKANGTFNEIPKPAFVLEQELAEKEKSAKKEKASGKEKIQNTKQAK